MRDVRGEESEHGTQALRGSGVSASYGKEFPFRYVDVSLEHGESLRVTGVNGSGKSTLVRCLAGIQPMATGSVAVCGADLAKQPGEARRHLGHSDGDLPFIFLTGREHLKLGLRVYRLPGSAITDLLERFHDWEVARAIDTEIRRYSHGTRQQLSLLLAVLHDPCVLLLDEAVTGLDDETLSDWCAYLKERSVARKSLVYVEHRDEVAAQMPNARNFPLIRGREADDE
jgi:ABC-2 type transport system ATP-binding protein